MVGILVISEEVMELVYGRKLEKNGPVFSKMRSYPLGMVGGSIFGKMFGVVRSPVFQISFPFQFGVKQRGQDCGHLG